MAGKTYKSLSAEISDEKFEQEYKNSGSSSFVTWNKLQPYIEHAVSKRPNEKVVGIIIEENGISVRFERKK